MSRREDDEIEARLTALHAAAVATEACSLTGAQVLVLRNAVERAATVLGTLNVKSLPFAHRRGVETARQELAAARAVLARRAAPDQRSAGGNAAG